MLDAGRATRSGQNEAMPETRKRESSPELAATTSADSLARSMKWGKSRQGDILALR